MTWLCLAWGTRAAGAEGSGQVPGQCLLCVPCVDDQLPGARECFQSKHQSSSWKEIPLLLSSIVRALVSQLDPYALLFWQ